MQNVLRDSQVEGRSISLEPHHMVGFLFSLMSVSVELKFLFFRSRSRPAPLSGSSDWLPSLRPPGDDPSFLDFDFAGGQMPEYNSKLRFRSPSPPHISSDVIGQSNEDVNFRRETWRHWYSLSCTMTRICFARFLLLLLLLTHLSSLANLEQFPNTNELLVLLSINYGYLITKFMLTFVFVIVYYFLKVNPVS